METKKELRVVCRKQINQCPKIAVIKKMKLNFCKKI